MDELDLQNTLSKIAEILERSAQIAGAHEARIQKLEDRIRYLEGE